jgi:hypothetical protein
MNALEEAIGDLINSASALARRTVTEYTPVVDSLIRANSKDSRHIEHTLDGLLGFCFDPEALPQLLCKKRCRHDCDFNPAAAAEYVRAYSEMCDSGPEVQL